MTDSIAERTLRYRASAGADLRTLTVRVFPPFQLQEGQVNFPFQPGTAGCIVRIDGLPEVMEEVTYGADSVQALELAVRGVEPILERVGKRHELFFPTGEPYFEE
jgi:hypothetical protein